MTMTVVELSAWTQAQVVAPLIRTATKAPVISNVLRPTVASPAVNAQLRNILGMIISGSVLNCESLPLFAAQQIEIIVRIDKRIRMMKHIVPRALRDSLKCGWICDANTISENIVSPNHSFISGSIASSGSSTTLKSM